MGSTKPLKKFVVQSDYNNTDRRCWFDNLLIKTIEGDNSIQTYDYTVNWVCDGTIIKSSTRQGESNASIELSASDKAEFTQNDVKYIYVSDDASTKTVAEDGSTVVTLTYRKAATYSYTIVNNLGTELSSGTGIENDNISYYFPGFDLKEGSLYQKARFTSNPYYGSSFTLDSDNKNITVDGYADPIANIVYYSEAENIEGATAVTSGNADVRCSAGKGAYFASDATITQLPAGSYKIWGQVWGGATTEFTVKAGDTKVWSLETTGSLTAGESTFDLESATDIVIPAVGNVNRILDCIYIQFLGDKHTYAVKAVKEDGTVIKTLAEGEGYSLDADKVIGIPEFVEIDGTLYQTDANTKDKDYYRRKISLKDGDQTITVTYKKTNIDNVVFLSEAEDLEGEGVTASSASNANVRCSDAEGAYFTSDVDLGVFNPSNYRIWGQVWGNSGTTFTITAGSDEVWSAGTTGSLNGVAGDIFAVNTHTNLYVKQAGDKNHVLDCFYVQDMGNKYTYRLNARSEDDVINQTLDTGFGYANDGETYVYYPRYINASGVLYEAEKTNGSYRIEFKRTQDEQFEVEYKKTDITDVVFFAEGENIDGALKTQAGTNMATRSSNGACGYVTSDISMTRLPRGNYQATMVCYSNNSGGATQKFNFGDEDNDFEAKISGASNGTTFKTDVFSLNYYSDIKWLNNGAGNVNGLDYIYIQSRGDSRTYKVTAKSEDGTISEVLADSTGYANDKSVTASYPKYKLVDGTLYEAKPNGQEYRLTFDLEEDRDLTVDYTKNENLTDIVFYSEAEQIEGLTAVTSGNADVRCSDAQGAFAAADSVKLTTLEAGKYKLAAALFGNAGTTFNIFTATDTLLAATTTGSLVVRDSVFVLKEAADLLIAKAGNGGSSPKLLDYIYIQKQEEEIVPEPVFAYTVNIQSEDKKIEAVLAQGADVKADSVIAVAYKRFVNVDSVLYEAQPVEGKYELQFSLTSDSTFTVDYAKTEIDSVIFVTEAVSVDSKGEQVLTHLEPGSYRLTAESQNEALSIVVETQPLWNGKDGDLEMILDKPCDLKLVNSGDTAAVLDFAYIQLIPEEPEPETDHIIFDEVEHAKSTAENPEAGIISEELALSQGSSIAPADEESGLSLWDNEDGAELRVAEGKSFFVLPPAGEKALHEIILKGYNLKLKVSNGDLSDEEPEAEENTETDETPAATARMKAESDEAETEPAVEEPATEEPAEEPTEEVEETLYWTGNINKVKFTAEAESRITSITVVSDDADEQTEEYTEAVEPQPESTDSLLAAAKELVGDSTGVAVGKLMNAIAAYEQVAEKQAADSLALQAAVAQYEKDNAAQENDQTAKVATNGWKKFETNDAAGVCATQYAPAIDTYDGRKGVQLAEVYESTTATTGQIIYQNITGLQNGQYKVGFYGNAFYTSGRGFDSDMQDGAEDVAYVFANDQKEFIVSKIATSTTENNFRTFNVDVTDGTIKLGMGKEKAGTNWHTMQIYQLTWIASAKEVYANDLKELEAAIEEAKALQANELKTEGKELLADAIEAAEAATESNMLNISELEQKIAILQGAISDFKEANLASFDGKYYIQNAATGKYMAAGHSWGTRGIVNAEGLDLTLETVAGKKVTIDSRVANSATSHFLGSGLYMDGASFGWMIEKQTEDTYTIGNGTQYIAVDADDNLILADEGAAWKFVAAETLEAERLAANMATLAAATKENGVDATFLIKTPQFNRNDQRNADNWTVSEDCTNKNLGGGCSGTEDNGCAESYHSTFTISQLLKDAPKGTYKLTAQGFYRQDGEATEDAPVFFINDATAEVPVLTGSENSMTEAGASFAKGDYTIAPIEFTLKSDSGLVVGIKGTAASQWVIFDNFQLTYYGEQVDIADMITGTVDFQELCMKMGKGGPWAVNDGGDAGFEVNGATMHYLGDYAEQGEEFVWGKRFAYEYVADRGKFTFRNKNNKKDGNCGMFSWDYAHNFSILGLEDGDKVTITIGTGTVTFVSTNVTEEIEAGAAVESNKAYTIKSADGVTRLDINMAKASLIAKIVIEKAGVETIPTISLDRKTLTLIPGATQKVTATVDPATATTQWKSDNEAVATVAADGTITAVAAGKANIINVWKAEQSDATVEAVCEVTVSDVDLTDYQVAKTLDFTTMGDVTLTLQEEVAGAIWNEANSKANNVFFCTNEGLEDIAVQAAVASNKGWSIISETGLNLASGAGRCAAIGNLKEGQIVEIIYTGDNLYTGSKEDAVRKDDGAVKTTLNEGVGRAIYKMGEDGLLGFELIKGNSVQKITVYELKSDGISNAIKAAAEKGAVYDMQGRKQTGKLRKGLYIMDGKVISVK